MCHLGLSKKGIYTPFHGKLTEKTQELVRKFHVEDVPDVENQLPVLNVFH